MAGEKKLVKVYVEKIIEWEIFLAVDISADVEDVALGLINDNSIDESNEGDPQFKSAAAPTEDELKSMIFLDEHGNEMAVVNHYIHCEGIQGEIKRHVK
jgi:hypothetical protein